MTDLALIIVLVVAILAVCLAAIVVGIYGIVSVACEKDREVSDLTTKLHASEWRNHQLERRLAERTELPVVGRAGRWVN